MDQQGDRSQGSNPVLDPGIRVEFKGLGNFKLGSCLDDSPQYVPRAGAGSSSLRDSLLGKMQVWQLFYALISAD